MLEAQLDIEPRRRLAELAQKAALELPSGDSRDLGQGLRVQRMLYILFHEIDDANHAPIGDAVSPLNRHALALARGTDSRVQELLGDLGGNEVSVTFGDEGKHQIERRGAAAAGDAVSIDAEQIPRRLDVGKFLGKIAAQFPMDGAAV